VSPDLDDCAKLTAACKQLLGAPQRHREDQDSETLRFESDGAVIGIVRAERIHCDIVLADAPLSRELDAALGAAANQ
jgi:hypothetical protein